MFDQHFKTLQHCLLCLAVNLTAGVAGADELWLWSHQAEGKGTANLFDGGPVDADSGMTSGPDDPLLHFVARDLNVQESASFSTSVDSRIIISEDFFRADVHFFTGYSHSTFGGALLGGTGEGWVTSRIEFAMPVEEVEWLFFLDIDRVGAFDGSTHVVIENVTESQTLVDTTDSNFPGVTTTLIANIGDIIRISTDISGSGTVPPDVLILGQYDVDMISIFTVPEPTTAATLLLAALILLPRRKPIR